MLYVWALDSYMALFVEFPPFGTYEGVCELNKSLTKIIATYYRKWTIVEHTQAICGLSSIFRQISRLKTYNLLFIIGW